jgi:hypothetical protein
MISISTNSFWWQSSKFHQDGGKQEQNWRKCRKYDVVSMKNQTGGHSVMHNQEKHTYRVPSMPSLQQTKNQRVALA